MTVQDYILDHQNRYQRRLLQIVNNFLTDQFELEAKIKYRIPFYYQLSWVCYLKPVSENAVELAFIHGHLLSNEHTLLQSKGRKQVMGIQINTIEEASNPIIDDVVNEALIIDEINQKGHNSKR